MLVTRLEKLVENKFFMRWTHLVTLGLRPGDSYGMKADRPAHWCANELVRVFLKTPCDSMLFLDSDADVEDDFVSAFRDYEKGWSYDVLQAFCTRRSWPPRPVWYAGDGMSDKIITDPDVCEPVKAVGLHSTLIRRRVFEGLLGADDPEKHEWFYYGLNRSEDISFSLDAVKAGYRFGATSAIRAGHLSTMSLGWETYQDYLRFNHLEATNATAMHT